MHISVFFYILIKESHTMPHINDNLIFVFFYQPSIIHIIINAPMKMSYYLYQMTAGNPLFINHVTVTVPALIFKTIVHPVGLLAIDF